MKTVNGIKFFYVQFIPSHIKKLPEEEKKSFDFAMELLVPEKLFREKVDGGMRGLPDLADFFDVPLMCVRYRAYELGYITQW